MATFTLEYWQEDGWFVGRLREVPACFSQGETLQELEQNITEVYKLLREEADTLGAFRSHDQSLPRCRMKRRELLRLLVRNNCCLHRHGANTLFTCMR